ncbi:Trehalose operon transcriptional repressor [Enterobacter cloacae]|uniref:Trehalose operon transcriptional repressor n=1 Tax=Enterobacter cloacae TaxID=550 RepID=A0A377M834_ENTCL|nr:Trehalose operon transcriptional repressor [Enterobacter cloacae]
MLPAFYEQGYDPIMMESQFSPQLVEEHLGMLARRNIDGVVLFGFTGIKEEMLKTLATLAGLAGTRCPRICVRLL